jgi:hypothetical protein
MAPPRYQDVKGTDIPVVTEDDGTRVRVVCGSYADVAGPVDRVAAEPIYLDVSVPAGRRKTLPVETDRQAFAYVFEGDGRFRDASEPRAPLTEPAGAAAAPAGPDGSGREAGNRSLVLFDRGDEIVVQAGDDGIRFLLVSGKPLEEPVAWYGPIVMNTQDELRQAVAELNQGTFIKHP